MGVISCRFISGEFGTTLALADDLSWLHDFTEWINNISPANDGLHAPVTSFFYWCAKTASLLHARPAYQPLHFRSIESDPLHFTFRLSDLEHLTPCISGPCTSSPQNTRLPCKILPSFSPGGLDG